MRTSVNALDYCAPQYIQRYIGVSAVCAVNFLNYFRKVFLRARVSGCGFFNFFFFLFFFLSPLRYTRTRAFVTGSTVLANGTILVAIFHKLSYLLSIRENFSLSGYAPTAGREKKDRTGNPTVGRGDGQESKGKNVGTERPSLRDSTVREYPARRRESFDEKVPRRLSYLRRAGTQME